MIFGHGAVLFIELPISAPRYLIVSPSLSISIVSGMVCTVFVARDHVSSSFCLYSGFPTGIVTVLSLLNFAPDAIHHLSKSSKSVFVPSLLVRKTATSLANRDNLLLRLFIAVSILIPWIF